MPFFRNWCYKGFLPDVWVYFSRYDSINEKGELVRYIRAY